MQITVQITPETLSYIDAMYRRNDKPFVAGLMRGVLSRYFKSPFWDGAAAEEFVKKDVDEPMGWCEHCDEYSVDVIYT